MSVLVLQHVPHETLGTLEVRLADVGIAWRYVELFRDIPQAVDWTGVSGLVVLGGPMNVDQTDRYPFLARDVEWIRQALDQELPILGICLGAQLLAKTLGAAVYPNRVKEIGWYGLRLTDAAGQDPIFRDCDPDQTVFQWHGDTFDLPEGAVHLARSERCAHQAFRYGLRAWGLQFHVEMTRELIHSWLGEPENMAEIESLPQIDAAAIRDATAEQLPRMGRLGQPVLAAFVEHCAGKQSG